MLTNIKKHRIKHLISRYLYYYKNASKSCQLHSNSTIHHKIQHHSLCNKITYNLQLNPTNKVYNKK